MNLSIVGVDMYCCAGRITNFDMRFTPADIKCDLDRGEFARDGSGAGGCIYMKGGISRKSDVNNSGVIGYHERTVAVEHTREGDITSVGTQGGCSAQGNLCSLDSSSVGIQLGIPFDCAL